MQRLNRDFLGGGTLLAICAFFYVQMAGNEFSAYGMYFPERVLPILAILAVLIIIKGFVKPSRAEGPIFRFNKNMIITLVTGLCWVFLLERLGFLLVSFLCLFGLQCVFTSREERSLKSVLWQLAGSLVTVVFFYHIFVQYLGVTLPKGLITFM